MSDRVTAWIEERQAIHEAAAEPSWWTTRDISPPTVFAGDGSADDIAVLTAFKRSDAIAVVDAHSTLPALLTAVEKVLEVLDAGVRDGDSAELIRRVALMEIKGAINE